MWKIDTMLAGLVCAVTLSCQVQYANAADQVLATVDGQEITARDLESAIASSPFYTQFNTMGEDEQAGLRGDMLRRLVAARLLALEAKRVGLDKTAAFKAETAGFRRGLLYRSYMEKLRSGITIPADTLEAMKQQFKGDADGFEAAKSSWVAMQFKTVKHDALQQLLQDGNVKIYETRIKPGIKPNAVLMEGRGFRISYGDIVPPDMRKKFPNPEWIRQQLRERGESMLVSMAAERDGVNVSMQLDRYVEERLPALMLEKKTREWIPNENVMRSWYAHHQEAGRIPTSYHVGQLVVASKEEAESLRARILKGESLFNLAASYSIDTVGRKNNGDIGWVTEGRGVPELQKVLATLPDDQVSEVIRTSSGYNLITVVERRNGKQKAYQDVRDRVQQMMVNEKMPAYLGELQKRYPVSWGVMATQAASQPVVTQ